MKILFHLFLISKIIVSAKQKYIIIVQNLLGHDISATKKKAFQTAILLFTDFMDSWQLSSMADSFLKRAPIAKTTRPQNNFVKCLN
jgi:hypothetical protein